MFLVRPKPPYLFFPSPYFRYRNSFMIKGTLDWTNPLRASFFNPTVRWTLQKKKNLFTTSHCTQPSILAQSLNPNKYLPRSRDSFLSLNIISDNERIYRVPILSVPTLLCKGHIYIPIKEQSQWLKAHVSLISKFSTKDLPFLNSWCVK
jgi:hypothetical protein